MRKSLLFLMALVLSTASANAQSAKLWETLPESAQKVIASIHAAGMSGHASNSMSKQGEKQIKAAYGINWDTATYTWSTDTFSRQSFTWNQDGSLKESTILQSMEEMDLRILLTDMVEMDMGEGDLGFGMMNGYFPKKIEVQMKVGTLWIGVARKTYTLDNNGRITQSLTEEPAFGTGWVPSEKTVYLYDNQGSYTGEEDYTYEAGQWELTDGSRNTFTYSNGHIVSAETEGYDEENMSWYAYMREDYTLANDGKITSVTRSYYDDSTAMWTLADSIAQINWHHFAGQPTASTFGPFAVGGNEILSYVDYTLDSTDVFTVYSRTVRTYTNDKLMKEEREIYDNGTWEAIERTLWAYNSHGDQTSETKYHSMGMGQWEESSKDSSDYAYDQDDDMTRRDELFMYNGMVSYGQRYIFEYNAATVGFNAPVNAMEVKLYPNPAASTLNLSLALQSGTAARVSIADINGREIMAVPVSSERTALDISSLSGGTYILTLTTRDGSRSVQRFVKN